jgi:hypothetical protein
VPPIDGDVLLSPEVNVACLPATGYQTEACVLLYSFMSTTGSVEAGPGAAGHSFRIKARNHFFPLRDKT